MAKWLELAYTTVSKTVGHFAHTSSNLVLATLSTLFACLLIVDAQDESSLRPELQEKLCQIMIHRYLEPVDSWIENRKAGAVFPHTQDNFTLPLYTDDPVEEHWFVLVIQHEKTFDNAIWVKFYISYKELQDSQTSGSNHDTLDETEFWPYIQRKKNGLAYQLEQAFIENMNDPNLVKTIIRGQSHLYSLVSRDTKIENLKKEDLIY